MQFRTVIIQALLFLFVATSLISQSSARTKKVFVHYLPWYDGSGVQFPARTGWCYPHDNIDCSDANTKHYSNEPLIGEYTLFDDDVLEYHLLQMYVTGIDGVIININAGKPMQQSGSVALVQKMYQMKNNLANFDMKYIISYDDGGNTNEADILQYMQWTYDNFYGHAQYGQLAFNDDDTGKAVYITWSESNPEYYYNTIRYLFGNNVVMIIRNAVNFQYADANMEWPGSLNVGLPKTSNNYGANNFNDFDWLIARQTERYGIAPADVNTLMLGAVYPGFDDENVPAFWNGGTNRYFLRNVADGETMTLLWQRQINYFPRRLGGSDSVENSWIQIVTWNDWPEGTSIEPATDSTYGYRPLEICHDKIPVYKGIPSPRFALSYLRFPHQIFLLRKQGSQTEADNLVTTLMASQQGGSGQGDPHFVGFDKSRFDFHGEHGKNYVLFGKYNGDVVVGKVRATAEMTITFNKTYFHEIGIQAEHSSDKFRFYMEQISAGHFEPRFTVNSKPVSSNCSSGNWKLFFSRKSSNIVVETRNHIIKLVATSLNSRLRHHVDFKVQFRRNLTTSDRFTGILGHTLTNVIRPQESEKIASEYQSATEISMRTKYVVSRLFPSSEELLSIYQQE